MLVKGGPGGYNNIMGFPSELKYHDIYFAHTVFLSCPVLPKFLTEYGSNAFVLCRKLYDDLPAEMDLVNAYEISWDLRLK